jgi:hypothetical protein
MVVQEDREEVLVLEIMLVKLVQVEITEAVEEVLTLPVIQVCGVTELAVLFELYGDQDEAFQAMPLNYL